MKEAIKSWLNYAGTEKKGKDFLLQNTLNKILKFLSWLTEESPNHNDWSLWSVAPIRFQAQAGALKVGRLR